MFRFFGYTFEIVVDFSSLLQSDSNHLLIFWLFFLWANRHLFDAVSLIVHDRLNDCPPRWLYNWCPCCLPCGILPLCLHGVVSLSPVMFKISESSPLFVRSV